MTPPAHHRALLSSIVAGRRCIVVSDVLVAAAATGVSLRDHGAAKVLAIAGSRGTGPIDPELERGAVVLGLAGRSIMDGMRLFEAAVAAPSQQVVDAVGAFDPDGDAIVLGHFATASQRFLGRELLGARPDAWRALEDKTLVDELWDRAGVRRAPSAIVPADHGALVAAAAELDAGAGTVWVADNRLGWHGGAEYLHWVRDAQDAEVAARRLLDQAHVVRVMPFLDGLPCSIHGWVFDDAVATFRPCEMVVLRVVGRSQLRYAGAATAWHPQPADLLDVREVAQRVGRQLRDEVDYRGVFTVDGVMTADGFRPTELNPRFGAGLAKLGRGTDLPLDVLHAASVTHPELDWRPELLEQLILGAAAEEPVANAYTVVADRVEATREVHIRRAAERFVVTPEPAHGTLALGPGPAGGLVRMQLDRFEPGAAVAPDAVRAFALAREVFGVDLPDLAPAPDLRR